MQYFFIGGAPKSGTTWVQRAVDSHPEIVCSGEGHFHEFIIKPMLEMYKSYNRKLEAVGQIVYEGRPYYPLITLDEMIQGARKAIIDVMSRRLRPEARALGDKTPTYAFVVRDLNMIFPDMSFIFVVRDPRDVAASRLNHAWRTHSTEALDRASKLYRDVVNASAENWVRAHERCSSFACAHPDRILFVRYEDLLGDSAAHLKRAFDFLKVETSPRQLDAIVAQSSFETLAGGRKSGVEDKTSFYRKGVRGDWPNALDGWAIEAVTSACRRGMEAMGYPP